jgi:hypothetical protein
VPTQEEKYYDAMNTLLAPVRWVKSLIKGLLLIAAAVGIGLFYPLILHFTGHPVTIGAFAVTGLTLLSIFTFCYAPWHTVVGGIICFVVFYALCFSQSFVDSLSGNGLLIFVFTFLTVGILQRYLRKQGEQRQGYQYANRR